MCMLLNTGCSGVISFRYPFKHHQIEQTHPLYHPPRITLIARVEKNRAALAYPLAGSPLCGFAFIGWSVLWPAERCPAGLYGRTGDIVYSDYPYCCQDAYHGFVFAGFYGCVFGGTGIQFQSLVILLYAGGSFLCGTLDHPSFLQKASG